MSAVALHQQGKLAEAKAVYESLLQSHPKHADTLHLLGVVEAQLGQSLKAVELIAQALHQSPNNTDYLSNYGNALFSLGQFSEALTHYEKVRAIQPKSANAHVNYANVLQALKQFDEAMISYNEAIRLDPNYAQAYSNRGAVFQARQQYDAAISDYDQAILINPSFVDAHHNLGNVMRKLGRQVEAEKSYRATLKLQPNYPYLYGDYINTKLWLCEWSEYDQDISQLKYRINQNIKCSSPFWVITLISDLAAQYKATQFWASEKYPVSDSLGGIKKRSQPEKIRIGYFSADFHHHATSLLMAGLFERHDKERFELFAFSFGPDKQDAMRQRLLSAFDHFFDVKDKIDEEIAHLSRSWDIDIAVDLKGYTQDSRTGIFAYRAAPIQVNYLGYPGTMGVPYMDYLIADPILIPASSRQYYSEKIAYLPDCYQVNDRCRKISDRVFTRIEVGLPEEGFVYCCFNNNYKITPNMFDSWVRILRAVPGSVLWLFEENPTAAENLRNEAEIRGLDANRLVFAQRMELPEHLARHRLADLFLDTLPCNAHTTASDALWAGLPVLTQKGESFAARVAASLLTAINLPELITNTAEEYEALAIRLASHPEQLSAIKAKLQRNRLATPLFDTDRYTMHLEQLYSRMYERYQADLLPEHMLIGISK
jgi:tetratricopeptide (TPR) repeat protein